MKAAGSFKPVTWRANVAPLERIEKRTAARMSPVMRAITGTHVLYYDP